ncbi:MAG: hypothetical protein DMF70_06100 [Acidobacteria bacterium]|nr:MAG: hypothetical protein DMF70_06100 [Acidobacteriota bacterium]
MRSKEYQREHDEREDAFLIAPTFVRTRPTRTKSEAICGNIEAAHFSIVVRASSIVSEIDHRIVGE